MSDARRLADDVSRIGRASGLDAVGVCDAQPFEDARRILRERAARGWSAGMQFTFRNPDRSTDPQATLPGATAIVVGARRYERRPPTVASAKAAPAAATFGPARPANSGATAVTLQRSRPAGRVAMYSWIDHYRLLRIALATIADHLSQQGWRARVLVDDNALVDRAAAVRAGIGWYGKNTNVLLPGAGSWFVLGSVITDAPLVEEVGSPSPVADGCGTCGRCLAACPTGALVGPGEMDARRCLAWLLQAPGVFPVEFREALGDRLYGCDDCQTSCPVNRIATRRHPPPEPEVDAQPAVDVLELLAVSDATLMTMVGRWYIPGREARYVRRNALVVLGNCGDPADPAVASALSRALADADPIVRSHAVWAAARLGRRDLLRALSADDDPLVAAELARAARPPSAAEGIAAAGAPS